MGVSFADRLRRGSTRTCSAACFRRAHARCVCVPSPSTGSGHRKCGNATGRGRRCTDATRGFSGRLWDWAFSNRVKRTGTALARMVPRSELTRRAKHIIAKYEGTRLGRQELMGDILDSSEGAPWTRDMLEAARDGARSEYVRIVVAVDPAVSANVSRALTGIVVAARGHDGRGYVLADLTGRFSPDGWARVAVDALEQYKADRIVAESPVTLPPGRLRHAHARGHRVPFGRSSLVGPQA